MKRIFQFSHCTLHLYRKKIILFSVLSIGSSLISLFNTLLSGRFIDFLASPNCVEWKPQLCYYCILFLATIMISFAISFALGRIREKLHTMVSYNINRQMLVHIQQIPFSKTFFLDSSRITQQLQTDSNEIASYCINVIQNVPVSSVRLITVSVITYQINKTVFGILLILAALYIVFFEIFKGKLYNTTREFKNEQALFFSKAQEQLRYIKFVKRHGLIDVFINRVDLAFQSLFKTAMHAQIFQYIFSGIDSMLLALSQIGLFLVGGVAVLNGEMSIGGFTTINVYFSSALGCIRYFFSLTSSTQNALVSLNRLMDVAKMQSESDGKQIVSNIKAIYLQDISLSFDKPVLKSFNAAFYKGNIYALCGDNGTGKSSVLHLVAGLYNNLYGGNIYFDDFDIKKLNMNFLRKSLIGFVEQEPQLLADKIISNLYPYNINENYELEEIDAAIYYINKLGMNDWLDKCCDGLNTYINEKSDNISGGEKQKLSIIRELLKKPLVLLLDEPTSAMDADSINTFFELLNAIKNDTIIIIATHDSRALHYCDSIVPLK